MSIVGKDFTTPLGHVAILNRAPGNIATKGFTVYFNTDDLTVKKRLLASLDGAFTKHADGSYIAPLSEISNHIKTFVSK